MVWGPWAPGLCPGGGPHHPHANGGFMYPDCEYRLFTALAYGGVCMDPFGPDCSGFCQTCWDFLPDNK